MSPADWLLPVAFAFLALAGVSLTLASRQMGKAIGELRSAVQAQQRRQKIEIELSSRDLVGLGQSISADRRRS